MADEKQMSPAEREARQMLADKKLEDASTKAYNKASTTAPAPVVKKAKGGVLRKARKFGGGGVTGDDLEAANASEDPIATLNERKGWTGGEAAKKPSFKEAFAEARKGGGKTFEWNGKKFTTEVAGEKAAAKPSAKVTDTGDETARLASRKAAPAAKPSYETSYDRMNRQNREAAAARSAAKDTERAELSKNIREGRSGAVNPKTLLPEKAYKAGGAVKGWGIARAARKAKLV